MKITHTVCEHGKIFFVQLLTSFVVAFPSESSPRVAPQYPSSGPWTRRASAATHAQAMPKKHRSWTRNFEAIVQKLNLRSSNTRLTATVASWAARDHLRSSPATVCKPDSESGFGKEIDRKWQMTSAYIRRAASQRPARWAEQLCTCPCCKN